MLHVCVHKKGPPSFRLETITLETCTDVHNYYIILIMNSNEELGQALGCNAGNAEQQGES
jgi:hypothetical protein